MQFYLEVPQGKFELKRFPVRKNDLLQAWDAADEYLLKHLADAELPAENQCVVILNDGFGALAVALHSKSPIAISDSFLSQQATRCNLRLNALPESNVQLYDSLSLPEKQIDSLLIKIPKTLALLEDQLHRLRPFLKPDSRIIAAGMVKNTPLSVWKILEKMLGPTTTSLAVKKARLIFATLDSSIVLTENPYPQSYLLENTEWRIHNHANVFSRDSLDIGARFLLRHLPVNPAYQDFIDLGCGNGVIGLMLASLNPQARVKFVDESFMAVNSARLNFAAAFGSQPHTEFIIDDCLSSFASNSADCIVCNPPFHQQHAIGEHIARQMFQDAQRVLRKGGEFRVIGNRHLQYHLILKKLFGDVRRVAANDKFVILSCVN